MKPALGFTLVELLVVLLVLSLVAGMAVFSMGVFRSSHDLENTTQALGSRLRLAQMEATFEQEAIGIALDEHGYRFYRKATAHARWELIQDKPLFKPQAFPRNTAVALTVNGQAYPLDQGTPQVILQQGSVPSFELVFRNQEHQGFGIASNAQGEVVWTAL